MLILLSLIAQFTVTSTSPSEWGVSDSTALMDVTVRNDSGATVHGSIEVDMIGCTPAGDLNITVLDGTWSSWLAGTSRTVTIAAHLYALSSCTACTSASLAVSIRELDGTLTVASGQVNLTLPQSGVAIVERAARLKNPLPNGGYIAHSDEIPVQLTTKHPIVTPKSDASTKVFFAFDWDTYGHAPNTMWDYFVYPIATGCGLIHLTWAAGEIPHHAQRLVDQTGLVAGATAGVIPLAPLGGGGGQSGGPGSGWNFFDIGELVLSCAGGTIRSALSYASPPYMMVLDVFQPPAVIREAAIFLGRPTNCEPGPVTFGPAPGSSFRMDVIQATTTGDVACNITVPNAWKTGTQLSSQYAITWRHLQGTTIDVLGFGNPSALSLNTSGVNWQTHSQIEALIEHLPSGSMVSVRSPLVPLSIKRVSSSFTGAESPADAFLDPGETEVVTWSLMNTFADAVTSLTVNLEESPDWQASSGVSTPPSSSLPGMTSSTVVTTHELLASPCCISVEAALRHTYIYRGVQFDVPLMLPFRISADDAEISTSIDQTWVPSVGTWNGTSVTPGGSGTGWNWAGGAWSVQGDEVNTDSVYILTSPVLSRSDHDRLLLNHMPGLPLAGGALEFRTRTDGVWNDWADFPLHADIQSQLSSAYRYNNGTFYTDPDSYFAGKRCWRLRQLSDIHSWAIDVPLEGDELQLRFVAQEPYWTSGWSHMWWRILDLNWVQTIPAIDTYLLEAELPSPCRGLAVIFDVVLGSYTVRGYATLDDLVNDMPSYETFTVGEQVAWPSPPDPDPDHPFLYIEVVRASDGARRIWEIPIMNPTWQGGEVPPLLAGLPWWITSDVLYDLDESSVVDMLDYVLLINADSCDVTKRGFGP